MNYYTLIPLCSFIINFFNWTYIFSQKRKNPVNRAYLFLVALFMGWAIESFVVWSPINEAFLVPILKFGALVWLMIGFSFLNFTYALTRRDKDYIYYVFLALYIVSGVIEISTDLFINGYVKNYWGDSDSAGILYAPLGLIVIILPLSYSILVLFRKRQLLGDLNSKKQTSLIIHGACITIFIGAFSNFILPHIFKINVVRIGSSATIIWSIFMLRAIIRYNFLSITVEEAANDLFTNVRDGIVLLHNNRYVIQMNNAAKEIFDLDNHFKFQDLNISDMLESYNFQENYKGYETKIYSNDKIKIVSLSQASVKQENAEVGKILIIRDITESKRAEQELHTSKTELEKLAAALAQINTSLEQKVAERTRSLLLSNEQLQREITERKRAEEALAAEKERLAVTLGSIGDGVISTDTTGHIVLLNKVAEQLTGWSQGEVIGQPLAAIFHVVDEKTRTRRTNPVEAALHAADIVSHTQHAILLARDQTERLIAESTAPIRDQEGQVIGAVLVFRDITERRKLEEELMKADKLESIGMLAGGIAHDFNNILTAIIGNISLAKMYAKADDKVYARLLNAEKASLQAQNLTQQLLTFSKGDSLVRKPSSIVEIVKESIDFSLRGANVRCELLVNHAIWPVEVDAGQISQVVNNLIINANQAMPDGGIIAVTIENVEIKEEHVNAFLPLNIGKYIKISVQDNGVGIPEEIKQKVFDPYFTTKKKGSGLGLFSCYSIIKKHDGHIAVESTLGVGTTFYVYLPASHREIIAREGANEIRQTGRGYILIMEDEETIRDVTGEMLGHFGYEVAFARDGLEAIELYTRAKTSGKPFDVIIMDLTIPGGMGGKEAIRRILDIDPQAKAVVASGYATDPIIADFREYGFCERIAKPYKSEELHAILHRIITGTAT
jgi:PAS domain S-box-containing protein